MNTILLITSVIIIILGVLQIVLFFNVWKMTDDVNKITLKLYESKKR